MDLGVHVGTAALVPLVLTFRAQGGGEYVPDERVVGFQLRKASWAGDEQGCRLNGLIVRHRSIIPFVSR